MSLRISVSTSTAVASRSKTPRKMQNSINGRVINHTAISVTTIKLLNMFRFY